MLEPGQTFPELDRTTDTTGHNQEPEVKPPCWFKFPQGAVTSQTGSTQPMLGYALPVPSSLALPRVLQHPSLGLSGATLVLLFSPGWGLIPRCQDTAWPSPGMLPLLAVSLGLITAQGSNALFFSPASHPISSLNRFTCPSHLPLGFDFILFNHLHYCSIEVLLFAGKNFYLE